MFPDVVQEFDNAQKNQKKKTTTARFIVIYVKVTNYMVSWFRCLFWLDAFVCLGGLPADLKLDHLTFPLPRTSTWKSRQTWPMSWGQKSKLWRKMIIHLIWAKTLPAHRTAATEDQHNKSQHCQNQDLQKSKQDLYVFFRYCNKCADKVFRWDCWTICY